MKTGKKLALAALACAAAFAGETQIWTTGDFSDYERAVLKNLSLRSDGVLTLAPRSKEIYDTSAPYLWALAQDSKGNLYAAGGTGAKLFRIPPGGPGKLVAEEDALEIHALAVDARDRVYFATSPNGKVYRMTGDAKPEVFYDPKATYIWALTFNSQGELLVATGGVPNGAGEIHKVAPDGKGTVFFKTDELHVRSMALEPNGSLIVGTEPGGLVMRISPAGEGFVMYQMARREVTAVAVGRDGAIYAAAVGAKQSGGASAPPPPSTPSIISTAGPATTTASPARPPASPSAAASVSGSEVYRIEPGGNPRRIWTHAQDVVYAISFDAQGRVLLGTGNKGSIYRVDSSTLYTALLDLPVGQITAFQSGLGGKLYAAAGNTGKVYEIGPETEREGTVQSDVYDSTMYSLWGRLSFLANLNGGQISVVTRSGNLDQPQKNWSAWSGAVTTPKGGRIASPAARFIQWKATLTADAAGHSPELESVDVAYLPKNLEPRVDEIEITPANYRFPAPVINLSAVPASQSLTLPPMGRRPSSSSSATDGGTSTPALTYAKGFLGARWMASDPNGDPMAYTVEIRGANETEWKPLKDKVMEKYFSWDATTFPDGEYRLRVTATDAPGNPPADALSASAVSAPFTIDNTPPKVSGLTATRSGTKLEVRWHAADALNNLDKAEYSLDGGDWTIAAPVTRISDSPELDYELMLDAGPGEHTVAVRVVDGNGNVGTDKVVVGRA